MIFLVKTTLKNSVYIFFVCKKYLSGKVIERVEWVFQDSDSMNTKENN